MGHAAEVQSPIPLPDEQRVVEYLRSGLRDLFCGAVLMYGFPEDKPVAHAYGDRLPSSKEDIPNRNIGLSTIFDLGCITSSMVVVPLVMRLFEERIFHVDERVARFLPGFGILGKSEITVRQLLLHSSGLPATMSFYEEIERQNKNRRPGILGSRGARHSIQNDVNRLELRYKPGTRQQFSEVGLWLLGEVLETVTASRLDILARRHVFQPAELTQSAYIDLSHLRARKITPCLDQIAATGQCSWRRNLLLGEVADETSWSCGGITGLAGVFSSAPDVFRFASAMLKGYHGKSDWLRQDIVREFWERGTGEGGRWRHGWDSPSIENGLFGSGLSPLAAGLTSQTGCSVWMDPGSGFIVVLLTAGEKYPCSERKFQQFFSDLVRNLLHPEERDQPDVSAAAA